MSNDVAPVLEMVLLYATWDGGTAVNLSDGVVSARGKSYDPRVVEGGFGGVRNTIPIRATGLSSLTTNVKVADTDNKLRDALTERDQRNSTAQIIRVIPGSADDYDIKFTGLLDSWEFAPGQVTLNFKTDERSLRSYQPALKHLDSEWFHMLLDFKGSTAPLLYGKHDATSLNLKAGMLPTTPIWKDGTSAWYAVSLGPIDYIKDIYVDTGSTSGAVKQAYPTNYAKVYGSGPGGKKIWSVVQFEPGFFPDDRDTVTADAYGYNPDPGTTTHTGAEASTNPVTQLRHFIVNFAVERSMGVPDAAWDTNTDIIDTDTWDTAATYADSHGLEGSRFMKDQKTGLDTIREWCDSFPMFRPIWGDNGAIKLRILSPQWPGYWDGSTAVIVREDDIDNSFRYVTDPADITSKISVSYLYASAENKYLRTLDVQDLSVGEPADSSVSMPWQPARQV